MNKYEKRHHGAGGEYGTPPFAQRFYSLLGLFSLASAFVLRRVVRSGEQKTKLESPHNYLSPERHFPRVIGKRSR